MSLLTGLCAENISLFFEDASVFSGETIKKWFSTGILNEVASSKDNENTS